MITRAFSFGLGRLPLVAHIGVGVVLGLTIFKVLDNLIGFGRLGHQCDRFASKNKDPKADDFEVALKMAYADGQLAKKEAKLLDSIIAESSDPARLKKAKRKMAKLHDRYGDKLAKHSKLVDKYLHAIIYGDDKASKLLQRLKKRLDSKIDIAAIYHEPREAFYSLKSKKSQETVFDKFEIALTGVIADDKVNQDEITLLNGLLGDTRSPVELDLPEPLLKAPKAITRVATYTKDEASVKPVLHIDLDLLKPLANHETEKIDKSAALKTMYRAVSVDGVVNKQEIQELRRLMAA